MMDAYAHPESSFPVGGSSGYGHVPTKMTTIPFDKLSSQQSDNVDPNSSVRNSNRPYVDPHSGVMLCGCGHDLGRLEWPLAAGIHHLNNRCKWTCCGASWEEKTCSHDNPGNDVSKYVPWPKKREYNFDSAMDPSTAAGPGGRDAELLGALRKSGAADAAAALLDRRGAPEGADLEESEELTSDEADSDAGFGSGDFDMAKMLDPTPIVDAAGGGLYALGSGANAASGAALYAAKVTASLLHAQLLQPFLQDPVTVPVELEEILAALINSATTRSLKDGESTKKLLASVVELYLRILELSDAQFPLLEGWVDQAVGAWKKVNRPRL